MDGAPQFALPRLGRGTKALLWIYGVVGLGGAILFNYVPRAGSAMWRWLACVPEYLPQHAWTLVTAGFLTDPEHWTHLVFTLVTLFFLGPDLERRWGTWRFVRFVVISIVFGFVLSLAMFPITPAESGVLHPRLMFGPAAAMAALAVAWGRENAHAQIRFYMILPITGRALVWITLGFCVLGVFFPASAVEGVVTPFGGFIAGLLLAGSPSPLRALYLRAKLFFIRRRGTSVTVDLGDRPKSKKRGGPPLRVVVGGRDDRGNPKDKRYLN